MKAVVCRAWGGPEDLTIEDIPAPEPGPGQIRIAVQAASVNFARGESGAAWRARAAAFICSKARRTSATKISSLDAK